MIVLALALAVLAALTFLCIQGARGASALSYVRGVQDGYLGGCSYAPSSSRYAMYLDALELLAPAPVQDSPHHGH